MLLQVTVCIVSDNNIRQTRKMFETASHSFRRSFKWTFFFLTIHHNCKLYIMLLPGVKKHSDYASEYSTLLKKLHKVHQILTVLYLPLVIACMGFSCYFAYIHGAVSTYKDPGEDWEACYVVGNALQVPLAPVFADIGTKVSGSCGILDRLFDLMLV